MICSTRPNCKFEVRVVYGACKDKKAPEDQMKSPIDCSYYDHGNETWVKIKKGEEITGNGLIRAIKALQRKLESENGNEVSAL